MKLTGKKSIAVFSAVLCIAVLILSVFSGCQDIERQIKNEVDKQVSSAISEAISGIKSEFETEPVSTQAPTTNKYQNSDKDDDESSAVSSDLRFRNDNLLNSHYKKHGIDMGFTSAEEYQQAAAQVVSNPSALHKTEKEDGDDVYYVESTNEFVIVSQDGYIRTYFNPDRGIDYYNSQ